MSLSAIVLIAIALSMDALAVAIAFGITIGTVRTRHAVIVGAWFGIFQAIMPALGWFAGTEIQNLIAGFDHWIAFALLVFVGGHMLHESFQPESQMGIDPLDVRLMFVLAVATSIDALGAGLSFALLKTPILLPALLIGTTTFTISFCGVWVGKRAGKLAESRVKLIGGLILVGIGIKILTSHLIAQ